MKGQEEIMMNVLKFGVIILVVVMLFLTVVRNYVTFTTDIKSTGQETYDRFTLTEKILNAEECTKSRGVFYLDMVNDPSKECHFQEPDCDPPSYYDWSYSLNSEELGLETEGCKPDDMRFKTAQAIPVVLYNRTNKKYYTGSMLIYGEHGIYTPRMGTESSSGIKTKTIEKRDFEGELMGGIELYRSFKCDAPEEAKCRIESVNVEAEMMTYHPLPWIGRSKDDVNTWVKVNGKKKKEDLKISETSRSTGFFNPQGWKKWGMTTKWNVEMKPGETADIREKWSIKNGKEEFGYVYIHLDYRVICEGGKVYSEGECLR